jgi:signal transduction histidine kinase
MPINALIVEDDLRFLKLLEIRLKSWKPDINITHAPSLTQARSALDDSTRAFDLVILDQNLPDGMGRTLFDHPRLSESAVLAVSSDTTPELPAEAVKAGAQHFLGKRQLSEPLFIPLVAALIERNSFEKELFESRLKQSRLDTIKVLLGTLRHEINNPLSGVLGGAYLLRSAGDLDPEQKEALGLMEQSGNRIKHVINQLCEAAELEEVTKGQEQVFQVPGDPQWEEEPEK